MSELDEVADELYSGPPSDFIAHRDAAAKAARADGDRELAKEIGELRKPTVSAWLMNLLVRDDPAFADQVVALGEGLRDAERSLDGPALRELSSQRRALVRSLTARARKLAQPFGQRIGDAVTQELDATLTAALADPRVAREVTSGRLTVAREYAGFGSADTAEPTVQTRTPPPPKPKKAEEPTRSERPKLTLVKPAVDPEEARRARAEERRQRALDEAGKALAAAERVVAEARRAHDDALHLRDESAAQLERAERAAQDAHQDEDDLVTALAEIRRKLAAAGKAATVADKDVSQAQANLRHDEKQASTAERELQRAERARDAAAARRDEL